MARKFDLKKLRSDAQADLREAINIITKTSVNPAEYLFTRWVCKMVAVDIHGVWERFIEDRAAAALNHDPHYFLKEHDVRLIFNSCGVDVGCKSLIFQESMTAFCKNVVPRHG